MRVLAGARPVRRAVRLGGQVACALVLMLSAVVAIGPAMASAATTISVTLNPPAPLPLGGPAVGSACDASGVGPRLLVTGAAPVAVAAGDLADLTLNLDPPLLVHPNANLFDVRLGFLANPSDLYFFGSGGISGTASFSGTNLVAPPPPFAIPTTFQPGVVANTTVFTLGADPSADATVTALHMSFTVPPGTVGGVLTPFAEVTVQTTCGAVVPASPAQQAQIITFGPLADRVVAAGAFTVAASATSGQPVSFASDTPAVCSVSGTTVTPLVPGTCTVRASQPGSDFQAPAPDVIRSFAVTNPAPTGVSATAGDRSASVSWTAPAAGPVPTGYTVTGTDTTNPAAPPVVVTTTGTGTSADVTGLTAGDAYTFTVMANYASGSSPASAPSAAVTPFALPAITGTPPNGTSGVAYSFAYTVAGVPAPTVTLSSGTLPAGLSLSPAGVLSGSPTTAGSYSFTLTADNGHAPAATVTSTVVVAPGAAVTVTATAGSGQSATVNTAFATALAATVKDAAGNLVPNATVTFTVTAGSASFAGSPTATAVTNASGVATAPALTAGATAGAVTVTATSGAATPASFTETVTAPTGTNADLKVSVSTPATAARGKTFTATVTVTNLGPAVARNVVNGLAVDSNLKIMSVSSGSVTGNRVTFNTVASINSGASVTYTVTLQAPNKAGSFTVTAGTLSLTTPDPTLANNAASTTVKVS